MFSNNNEINSEYFKIKLRKNIPFTSFKKDDIFFVYKTNNLCYEFFMLKNNNNNKYKLPNYISKMLEEWVFDKMLNLYFFEESKVEILE